MTGSDRVFIIAEAGVNHDGDVDRARALIDIAATSGADAVKFQTYDVDALVETGTAKAAYQVDPDAPAETQAEMLRRLALGHDDFRTLQRYCSDKGIVFLSTPFDPASADFLETLDMPMFKVPSGEVTNTPFLAHLAAKGRPMIVSTGMSDMEEVAAAVAAIKDAGDPPLTLLHCVSAYPADAADVNLRAMQSLAARFGVPVGYSDHTLGTEIAIAAAALGARVIEKHFTIDRNAPGPDHKASLEPDELIGMVAAIRNVESALGNGEKKPMPVEAEIARIARKSLFAACDIAVGEVLSASMIAVRRPGHGMPPTALGTVIGRRTTQAIPAGTPLREDLLA
jgi:N,N'-diacetyllegionaminate synthase